MTSVPCIHNDGGRCTIPDPTAVVVEGRAEVWSRSRVEDEFPHFDPRQAELTPLDLKHIGGLRALTAGTEIDGAAQRALIGAASDASVTAGIVIWCSCGHTLIGEAGTAGVSTTAGGQLIEA